MVNWSSLMGAIHSETSCKHSRFVLSLCFLNLIILMWKNALIGRIRRISSSVAICFVVVWPRSLIYKFTNSSNVHLHRSLCLEAYPISQVSIQLSDCMIEHGPDEQPFAKMKALQSTLRQQGWQQVCWECQEKNPTINNPRTHTHQYTHRATHPWLWN